MRKGLYWFHDLQREPRQSHRSREDGPKVRVGTGPSRPAGKGRRGAAAFRKRVLAILRCPVPASSALGDGLALGAEAGDGDFHAVTGLQVARGLHAHADARRGAGGDHVARFKDHEL